WLLISGCFLELRERTVGLFLAEFRRDNTRPGDDAAAAEKPIGGKFWDVVRHICKSPYLFGLFLFIFLYTFTSNWTYFQQLDMTKSGFVDKAARTAFFAKLDLS